MEETELDRNSRIYWETYHWLEEYDNQVKQYERAKRLGVEYTPSKKMDYKTFPELDNLANYKATQLKELADFAYIDIPVEDVLGLMPMEDEYAIKTELK